TGHGAESLPAADDQRDFDGRRFESAWCGLLIEHRSLWRRVVKARLATLGGESLLLELPHRVVIREPDDVRHAHVLRDDAGREDEKRDDQICEQKSAAGGDDIGKQPPKPPAPRHDTLRSRAANAPSVPCRCGRTRRRPASIAEGGTAPSDGGSSFQSR